MKTMMLRWITALTILSLFILPFPALAKQASPFAGHWQAIDVDGSDIRLTIGGPPDGPFSITWTESYITLCNGEAGIVRGKGWVVEGDPARLEAELNLVCFTTGDSLDFSITWVYDPGTDTISSGFLTWLRPSAGAKACLPPPSGLTGWWPGDGDTNDLIAGRSGIFHGDAATGSGLVDLAFHLDGDGDFIDVPHDPALDIGTGDFTIDLWVNFNDTVGEQVLVEKWIQSDPSMGWTLTKLEEDVLRLATGDGQGSEVNLDSGPLSIHPGVWYHFVATRSGTAVTLYMNGEVVAHNPEMEILNLSSPSSLKFGHRGSPGDTPGSGDERGFYLNGRIDEVELLLGTSFSADQVLALYQTGSAGKCKDEEFRAPRLDLRVNYGHDWVESFYEAGHTIWITVTESDGVSVKASAEMVTEPKDFWGGEPGFQTGEQDWIPGPPDIQPYDHIFGRVDNGQTAHVQIGDILGEIDLEADSIQGTIHAPWFSSLVGVECHPWGSTEPVEMKFATIMPDGEEQYSCSWAEEWDIRPGQDVGVGYFGLDGHWVANAFRVSHTRLTTFPEWEFIEGWEWPWDAVVHLSIEDLSTDLSPDYEQDEPVVPTPWDPNQAWVTFNFSGMYDMKPGDVVTLSDGITTRTHTVQNLAITEVNEEINTVAGTADVGALVFAWVHGFGETEMQSTVENGTWLADFGSIGFDLQEGMCGRSEIRDEVGNSTAVDWCVPLTIDGST